MAPATAGPQPAEARGGGRRKPGKLDGEGRDAAGPGAAQTLRPEPRAA
jgi:hypothetical protein